MPGVGLGVQGFEAIVHIEHMSSFSCITRTLIYLRHIYCLMQDLEGGTFLVELDFVYLCIHLWVIDCRIYCKMKLLGWSVACCHKIDCRIYKIIDFAFSGMPSYQSHAFMIFEPLWAPGVRIKKSCVLRDYSTWVYSKFGSDLFSSVGE